MKKVIASTLAALSLTTSSAIAGDPVNVFAHADKLKFSGQTFLGYKYTDPKASKADSTQDFEIRRGYFQLKAYLLDDSKSYYRVTLDVTRESDKFDDNGTGATLKASANGSMIVRAKYAYLNLNEVLPATSLEIGLAHRPWHDYEEHNSWLYRSVSEVLIENKNSAHLSNSADFGVMAKTRTKYFDSDIGIFNGEGYHSTQNSNGMSLEWRFTGHLLGTAGHPEKNTYFDASFFGQLNQKHSKNITTNKNDDLHFYGLHTVFNMPVFLASAQYVLSDDTSSNSSATGATSAGSGKGFSAYTEGRLGDEHQYKAFARYDNWTPDAISGATKYTRVTEIAGLAWKQNKNVEWSANVTINDDKYATGATNPSSAAYMLTTEINF